MDPEQFSSERRLANSARFGQLLREANREFSGSADEAAAFRRLSERLSSPRAGFQSVALPLFAVAAVVVLGLFVVAAPGFRRPSEIEPLAAAEPPRVTPSSRPIASAEARPAKSPRALVAGTHHLDDGSVVTLVPGSMARVHEHTDATRVTLSAGRLQLRVARQTHGRHFEVLTDDYRFQVLGTQFEVNVGRSSVSLEVQEGQVAVWKRAVLVARVSAGQRWNDGDSASPAGAAREPTSAPRATRADSDEASARQAPDCLSLARQGSTDEAERCFLERAAGSGIGAEMALYEVARLRRDVLRDPNGSLAALKEYSGRFPNGSLRREADMFHLELLVQLGRSREALDRSNALLTSGSGRERAAELRLLRGDILRRTVNDIPAAEREYALAEQLTGAASTEATYLRGVCLEALGKLEAAAEAFQRYLHESPGMHAAEAQRRLNLLRPP